ncbi:MAG TPA: hypothetical protein EYN66_22220 [Myxococcales bacterium]|nr:hypothetical protein [Myxococcales bacterium]
MATSKTGSFWLTEAVEIDAAGQSASGTIDLGAYVDVGDQQAISIEYVDFIWQAHDTALDSYDGFFAGSVVGDCAFDVQLTDLNPGGLILRADDNSMVASASMNLNDANNVLSFGPDLYPDSFGKLDESRMVVNDSLYVVSHSSVVIAANQGLVVTARIKARIVKLSTKDWMSIAIQSTASDN